MISTPRLKPFPGFVALTFSLTALLWSHGAWAAKPEISKTKAALSPMEKPAALNLGYKIVYLADGEEASTTLTENADTLAWIRSDGCQYEKDQNEPWFTPTLNWQDCAPSPDGEQSFMLKGEIWPLAAGKKWKYQRNGRNEKGASWTTTTTCKVDKKTYHVKTSFGAWDTYKVECKDRVFDRTWYVSPEAGSWVYYKQNHIRRGLTSRVLKQIVAP